MTKLADKLISKIDLNFSNIKNDKEVISNFEKIKDNLEKEIVKRIDSPNIVSYKDFCAKYEYKVDLYPNSTKVKAIIMMLKNHFTNEGFSFNAKLVNDLPYYNYVFWITLDR